MQHWLVAYRAKGAKAPKDRRNLDPTFISYAPSDSTEHRTHVKGIKHCVRIPGCLLGNY